MGLKQALTIEDMYGVRKKPSQTKFMCVCIQCWCVWLQQRVDHKMSTQLECVHPIYSQPIATQAYILPKEKHCLRWSSHLPKDWKRKKNVLFLIALFEIVKLFPFSWNVTQQIFRGETCNPGQLSKTFPFCPAALAKLIHQVLDFPDQWSQKCLKKKYQREIFELPLTEAVETIIQPYKMLGRRWHCQISTPAVQK